jgi:hypothetical protein
MGLPYWSLSAYHKRQGQESFTSLTEISKTLSRTKRFKRGYHGPAACIHRAEIPAATEGVLYCK